MIHKVGLPFLLDCFFFVTDPSFNNPLPPQKKNKRKTRVESTKHILRYFMDESKELLISMDSQKSVVEHVSLKEGTNFKGSLTIGFP